MTRDTLATGPDAGFFQNLIGGRIDKLGNRITGFGDFLAEFQGPDRDPLGGLIPQTPVPETTNMFGNIDPLSPEGIEFSMIEGPGGVPSGPSGELGEPGPGGGGAPGTTDLTTLGGEASQVLDEAGRVRRSFAEQFEDLLSGRFDPATSPAFVAQREAIEDQFRAAEDEIRATLPAGGPLNSALTKLQLAKGRAISDTLSNILGQEREKAFQFATGQTGVGLGALEGAERLSLSELLGQQGLDLQKLQLQNQIEQAMQEREDQTSSDVVQFILNILGI
ncbi:MAG: hypothetical protein JRD68_00105 [Deltaproteobacteria bacterium]|nr:hypothetical protein [Deltaproteobacteria bacterium]